MRVASLMLFARDIGRTVEFYRALGVPLEPVSGGRFSADVGGIRMAVANGSAGELVARGGSPGTMMPGFAVTSIESAVGGVEATGGTVVRAPEQLDWGHRAILADPDGRTVEVVQYEQD